jgi:hypothetical protein
MTCQAKPAAKGTVELLAERLPALHRVALKLLTFRKPYFVKLRKLLPVTLLRDHGSGLDVWTTDTLIVFYKLLPCFWRAT